MGRLRLELRTNRLKAECSTTELATRLLRFFGEPRNVYYCNELRKKMQGILIFFLNARGCVCTLPPSHPPPSKGYDAPQNP